jgi:mannitol-1-phosphate/altronate dehydrogenase
MDEDNHAIELSSGTLEAVGRSLPIPRYVRKAHPPGITHVSVGNFHRAHQALYVDEALARGEKEWGIHAVGALPADRSMVEALTRQDGLYTLVERNGDRAAARVIGSLFGATHAPSDPEGVVEQLAAPETRIVTLTITENGYGHDPATGQLDRTRDDVTWDLSGRLPRRTCLGMIVEALARRERAGRAPLTVLSCDNIPSNGDTARRLALELAEARSRPLARWIERNISFPNGMVDRITPASMPQGRELVNALYGVRDAIPVLTEPFRQWVIEDRFVSGRPNWEESGVLMVDDVRPYELAKIRLLNVSHSALAYPGILAGLTFVHEAVRNSSIAGFVCQMMDEEIAPGLDRVPGMDIAEYADTLMTRFSNEAIADRLERICMDGSRKLSIQLFPIVRERLSAGQPIRRLAYVIASWLTYLRGRDDHGRTIAVIDPLSDRLARMGGVATSFSDWSGSGLFPADLLQSTDFSNEVSRALNAITAVGAIAALGGYID